MSSLTGPVVLAVCERQLPHDFLLQWVGWRSIIDEIPLAPLALEEEFSLLSAQGLSATDANEVAGVTCGNPLLIAVAGMVLSSTADRALKIAQETARLLFARLRSKRVDDATRTLIEIVPYLLA